MKATTAIIGGLALALGTTAAIGQQAQPSETPPATQADPATPATPADPAADAAATPATPATPADPATPAAKSSENDPLSATATAEQQPTANKKKGKKPH
jgi:hypothetical protein